MNIKVIVPAGSMQKYNICGDYGSLNVRTLGRVGPVTRRRPSRRTVVPRRSGRFRRAVADVDTDMIFGSHKPIYGSGAYIAPVLNYSLQDPAPDTTYPAQHDNF